MNCLGLKIIILCVRSIIPTLRAFYSEPSAAWRVSCINIQMAIFVVFDRYLRSVKGVIKKNSLNKLLPKWNLAVSDKYFEKKSAEEICKEL